MPFFIATELLNNTDIPKTIGNLFHKIMRPLFNVPGIGAYALFMGIISGYPIGAKIVTNFRNNNLCTKEEAERLITFTNNSGPLFILGTVGITLFYDTSIGLLLFFTHLLSSISVGIIFRFWKINKGINESRNSYTTNKIISFQSLGDILSKSIMSSIHSVVLIGGFIVLFGLILSVLQKAYLFHLVNLFFVPSFKILGINTEFIIPILTGLLELTNGVVAVSSVINRNLAVNIIICAFLLGFGGISIMLQVLSIISKSDLIRVISKEKKITLHIYSNTEKYLIIITTMYSKIYQSFIKVFLCNGQIPFSLIALICAAVPYPLCFSKPYCG